MKRIISIIASLALMIGLSPAYAGTVVFAAEGDIAVNETNFPDKNFRKWMIDNIGNNDSILTNTEITNITAIDVEDLNISNLKGIEYFTNLTELSCSDNELTSLDVSKLTNLERLYCDSNKLTSLDTSKLTKLRFLSCEYNFISSLTVYKGEDSALRSIDSNYNLLTSLDLSNNRLTSSGLFETLPILNIGGSSGAWTYDMSNIGIADLNKVTIAADQSATLDVSTGIVTFATAEKPEQLNYGYNTGELNNNNLGILNVIITEPIKNLDFTLTHNSDNKYTVSVDNVPADKKLLFIVPTSIDGKTDEETYNYWLEYYTKIMNGTDNYYHSAVGNYGLYSNNFTIKEITNNVEFYVDSDLEKQFIRGIGVCITDPMNQHNSSYVLNQAGMTKGPIDIGSSSGNKINAIAHIITVTGGKTSPSTAYKGDAVAITASNADTFDHWTSSADGVVFKDANNATTTFTMPDKDVTITAVEKTAQDAPKSSEITDGKGKINGTTAQMEYSLDQIIWKVCTEGSTAVTAGTYYVRYAATDTKKASEAVKVTVTSAVTDDEDDDYQVVNTAVK